MQVLVVAAALVAAACETRLPTDAGRPLLATADSAGGDSGTTTLSISKTAQGFAERQRHDSWWLGKMVDPRADTIRPGETDTLSYTIAVVRFVQPVTEVYGARGRMCLVNTGAAATDSLILLDRVEYRAAGDTGFQFLPGVVISGFPGSLTLAPGDSTCFDYELVFPPVPGASYRNVAQVLIDNYEGHLGTFFGPEATVEFTLPDSVGATVYDTSAVLTDAVYCSPGLSCMPSDSGPWFLGGDDTLRVTSAIRNDSAPCGAVLPLMDLAVLTTSGGASQSANDSALVYTGDCSPGCTRTAWFWLTHAGFTYGNPDLISPLLPIALGVPPDTSNPDAKGILVTTARQAAMILRNGLAPSRGNGIERLQGQLLAAKLNVRSGATATAVAEVISAADAFLTVHGAASWRHLTLWQRLRVERWVLRLEEYNIGVIGPGRCS
jgi:hypothetical protein